MAKKLQMTLVLSGIFPAIDPEGARRFEPGEENTKVDVTPWVRSQYAAGVLKDAPDCAEDNAAAIQAYDQAHPPKAVPAAAVAAPADKAAFDAAVAAEVEKTVAAAVEAALAAAAVENAKVVLKTPAK